MGDKKTRELERQYAAGDDDALDKLKREWLRSQSWHECAECNGTIPHDIWEEHKATCGTRARTGSMPVVAIPAPATTAGRPIKMCLYDHVWVEPDRPRQQVAFFSRTDKPLWRTNLYGQGESLPYGQHLFLYGVSLVPDARAPRDDVLAVWDTGRLSLRLATTTLNEWPAREVMGEQPALVADASESEDMVRFEMEASEAMMKPPSERSPLLGVEPPQRLVYLRSQGAVRDMRIAGKPIALAALQSFRWVLDVDAALAEQAGFMVVMYGILMRGITG